MTSSVTLPTLTPSSIVSSTPLTALPSTATACGKSGPLPESPKLREPLTGEIKPILRNIADVACNLCVD